MNSEGTSEGTSDARIDHLVYAAPDLETGIDAIEELLGVRPAPGGRHPGWGTQNALLSLGPRTYLEVVAPDPEAERPPRGRLFGVDEIERQRLVTWALAIDGRGPGWIERVAARAAAGVELGALEAGSRETPDGTLLSWKLTDPYAMPLGGAVPFLIDWGNTPHPAAAAPPAGELTGLSIEHPEPERVRAALAALEVTGAAAVSEGPRARMVATVRPRGARGEPVQTLQTVELGG